MLTYRGLKNLLIHLPNGDLDSNVTIHDEGADEYFAISAVSRSCDEDDVLDANHLILVKK